MMDKTLEQLKVHEGFRAKPYHCSEGKLTIGYGTNIEDGITEEEATLLLEHRLNKMFVEAKGLDLFDGIKSDDLNFPRRAVLANMLYNLGPTRLKGFKKMWAALRRRDYGAAADEMLDSHWARQVKSRADELAEQMRTGRWRA